LIAASNILTASFLGDGAVPNVVVVAPSATVDAAELTLPALDLDVLD